MNKKLLTKLLLTTATFFILVTLPVFVYAKSDSSGQGSGHSEKSVDVGTVNNIHGNTVVIDDHNKNKIDVQTNSSTKIIGSDKKKLNINSIKPHDKVAVISNGTRTIATDGAQVKKAMKIFVKEASDSAQSKRHAVQGIITTINGSTITLVHQIHRDRVYTILVDVQTIVTMKGSKNASISDLQEGQRIVVMGDLAFGGGILAKRIHIIPGKAIGIFKKNPLATGSGTSSPSASPTPTKIASPSATPTATISATPTTTP